MNIDIFFLVLLIISVIIIITVSLIKIPTQLSNKTQQSTYTLVKYDSNNNVAKYDLRTFVYNNIEYYPWIFSKGLQHGNIAMCTKSDGDTLISLLHPNVKQYNLKEHLRSLEEIALVKFEGLNCLDSHWLREYTPININGSTMCYPVDHIQSTCDMVEVYELSLFRDTPLYNIQREVGPYIKDTLRVLNCYLNVNAYTGPLDNGKITGKVLFRGIGKDEDIGPYVSQLLILPSQNNNTTTVQQYKQELDINQSIDPLHFINIQRGQISDKPNFSENLKYIYNGRGLGSIVHKDALYWAYYNACLILLKNNFRLMDIDDSVSTAWTNQGIPDLLSSVGDVALGALRCAWYTKYKIGMKIRPEMYAYRIHQILTCPEFTKVAVFEKILSNLDMGESTLKKIYKQNNGKSYLLKLMYPEGSPYHPTFPSGHAVVAGACVTVMKAFFKTHYDDRSPVYWNLPPLHSINGESLCPYTDKDFKHITLNGELNKLASNMSIGRNFSGVHFRSDSDVGMKLGEQFSIFYLQTKLREYNTKYCQFELQKLNGDFVKITSNNIYTL